MELMQKELINKNQSKNDKLLQFLENYNRSQKPKPSKASQIQRVISLYDKKPRLVSVKSSLKNSKIQKGLNLQPSLSLTHLGSGFHSFSPEKKQQTTTQVREPLEITHEGSHHFQYSTGDLQSTKHPKKRKNTVQSLQSKVKLSRFAATS